MKKSTSTIILVAGHEYNPKKGNQWDRPCLAREQFLAKRLKTRPLFSVTIDISKGTIREAMYQASAHPVVNVINYASAVNNKKNYTDTIVGGDDHANILTSGFDEIISMRDVYAIILDYVRRKNCKIYEFSIFSHAYSDGPILLNTYEFQRVQRRGHANVLVDLPRRGTLRRDPNDMDPRKTDFTKDVQSADDLNLWKRAFAPEGRCWIWGCNWDEDVMRLIRAMSRGSPHPRKNLSDNIDIVLDNLRDFEKRSIGNLDHKLLHQSRTKGKLAIQLGTFRRYVHNLLEDTYAQVLANAMGVPVYAAAPGTYADFKTGVEMFIPGNVVDIVDFYQRVLGRRIDSEGLGYIAYEPE